jgi:hypothetical protein
MRDAGRSARIHARKLEWQAHPLRIFTPHVMAIGAFAAALFYGGVAPTIVFWVCLPLAVYFLGVVAYRRHSKAGEMRAEAKRYRVGARTERKTARTLRQLGLRRLLHREAWFVLHDRAIEGSEANIDHIAIGPPGIVVIDTKSRQRKWDPQGNWLFYDHRPVDVTSSAWETEKVINAVNRKFGVQGVPVRSCWAIHSSTKLPFRYFPVHPAKGRFPVGMLPVNDLVGYVAHGERVLTNAQVAEVAKYLTEKFPPAS